MTPEEITVGESILTLMFFAIMLLSAYLGDKYHEYRQKHKKVQDSDEAS